MASTKGISEDFPGAYSGQGRSWELKTKEAIELLPDKYGFQPKVVLSAREPLELICKGMVSSVEW